MKSTCKFCAAPLRWGRLGNKWIPVDRDPVDGGRWVMDWPRGPLKELFGVRLEMAQIMGRDLYQSHVCKPQEKKP